MIFVGLRQCGKTYMMMEEVKKILKDGDTVGIISYNNMISFSLKEHFVKNVIKNNPKIQVRVLSSLDEIKNVDYAIIDELDLVLGRDKCFCSSGGVVQLERTDEEYLNYINNFDDKYTFTKRENKVILEPIDTTEKDNQKYLDLKESVMLDLSRMKLSDNLALFSAIQTLCDIEMTKKAILNSVQVKFDDGSYMNLDIKNNIDSLVQELRNYFEIITKNIKDGEC